MRQIVLDTETTGLDPRLGHRVIEIGGIELVNRRPTHNTFHAYLDPEREIDPEATKVHGMTWEDLRGKPRFADRAEALIEFIQGAELVIHNAPFDVGFLDAELALAGLPPLSSHCSGVLDTLRLAKDLHPGKRNSLDVLCDRYAIDNSGRELHGALLDAGLLADVYLAMTRGQESLAISLDEAARTARAGRESRSPLGALRVLRAGEAELAAHTAYVQALDKDTKGRALWAELERAAAAAAQPAPDAAAPTTA